VYNDSHTAILYRAEALSVEPGDDIQTQSSLQRSFALLSNHRVRSPTFNTATISI